MDSTIHARFWRVSAAAAGVTDFPDILLEEAAIPKVGDRERNLGEGVTARLERCVQKGDYLEGEFCRIQSANLPPEASLDGLTAMKLEHGLGHVAGFIYHVPTRVFLLQRNSLSVSPNRLSLYLATTKPGRFFTLSPVMAGDAMQRFKDKKARAFRLTFAAPKNLQVLDDDEIPAAKGARLLAEAYEGIRVTIEVSVGKSEKLQLNKDNILEAIKHFSVLSGTKKLQVKADDHGDSDLINFLKEQIHYEQTAVFPDDDPVKNYDARMALLRVAFATNLAALNAQFG